MLKKALTLSSIVLATTLTGCSSFMSGIGQSGLLNDGNQMSSDVKDQTTPQKRNQVSDAYGPIAIPADTVAMRLKEKFGFVSDGMWLPHATAARGIQAGQPQPFQRAQLVGRARQLLPNVQELGRK